MAMGARKTKLNNFQSRKEF